MPGNIPVLAWYGYCIVKAQELFMMKKTIGPIFALVIITSLSLGGLFALSVNAQSVPPEEAYVSGVVGYAQAYTLSCESRSAVDWAAFFGVYLTENQFLYALPRSDDPELGFVGNENGFWGNIPPYGYGVHAQPVADLLSEFGMPAIAQKNLTWDGPAMADRSRQTGDRVGDQ